MRLALRGADGDPERLRPFVAVLERYTERARQIVVLAHMEARLLDDEMAPRHVLLGLAQEPGALSAQLEEAGPTTVELRMLAADAFEHLGRPRGGGMLFSPQVQRVLREAVNVADELANDRVSQDHVALALLRSGDEAREMLGARADGVLRAVEAAVAAKKGTSITDFDGL